MERIGVVVKVPSAFSFTFRPFVGVDPSVGDFVAVEADGAPVLARVVAVRRRNAAVDPRLIAQLDDVEAVEDIRTTLAIDEALYYTEARAVVVGRREGNRMRRPARPPRPLTYVYRVDLDFLAAQMAPPEEGTYIQIGEVRGTGLPAYINADRLVTQHCAILAGTGAGKSWLAGVIVEALYREAKTPMVIVDPHGEYSAMSVAVEPEGAEVADAVRIYVVGKADVSAADRAFAARFGRERTYERVGVNPRSVPLRVMAKILEETYGLTEAQRRILEEGWQAVADYGERPPVTSVDELVREVIEGGRHVAPPGYAGEMALRGLEGRLKALLYGSPVFLTRYGETYGGGPVRLLDPRRLMSEPAIHVLDMSGLELLDQQLFLAVLMDQLYRAALQRRHTPVFVVVEEAHNFAPSRGTALSKPYLAKVAREGRKFGLGLCMISQRPTRLDPDIISQAMTQIFKRMINPADLRYVAEVAEHLEDPRQLRTLDEHEALVTGLAVPFTLHIVVGKRLTAHGGVAPRLRPT